MRNILSFILFIVSTSFLCAQSYKDTLFTSYFQRTDPGWVASDGTISLELPDGRSLWMMGDSYVDVKVDNDNKIPCLFNTRNSVLVQDAVDRNKIETFYNRSGTNVYERQFVNIEGQEKVTLWPVGGVVRGDTAYTFWTRYDYDTSAVWNLKLRGMVIAKIKLPEIEVVEVQPVLYPEIEYGLAVVWSESDQYYYLYGKIVEAFVFRPMIARCRSNNLAGQWEFYNGMSWSDQSEDAKPVAPAVSADYSVFHLNGKYHMFYQDNGYLQCGLGLDMFVYSSQKPEGPFENPVLLYTIQDRFQDTFPITYNGEAHPQFIEDGELLVSYNVNNVCPNICASNPFRGRMNADLYRPKFARVPLSLFTTTAVKEHEVISTIKISPNPSSGIFHIQGSNHDFSYELRDINGKLIRSGSSPTIDIVGQPSGIYFLQLINHNEELLQFKLVKE